jgi:hypothetical protein
MNTKHFRPLTDVLAALSSMLAIVAALPYELGEVSMIIAPEWKAKIAVAGAIATCIQRIFRPYLPKPTVENANDVS